MNSGTGALAKAQKTSQMRLYGRRSDAWPNA